jgi:hypothetical protein
MPDQVHAHHEIDRLAGNRRVRHERLRAHGVGPEERWLLAIERRDDHPAPVSLRRDGGRDLHEHGNGSGVVVGSPEYAVPKASEVIEVSAQDDEPGIVTVDFGEDVRTLTARHELFERIESSSAKRLDHHRPRGRALGRSRASPRARRRAQRAYDLADRVHRCAAYLATERRG